MKKVVFAVLLFSLCISVLHSADPEKVIKIASGKDFEPILFINKQGEPDGIHKDLWDLMGKKGGYTPRLILDDWYKCIPALLAGKVDAVHGVSYTESRAEKLDFSKVIYEYNVYIYFDAEMVSVNSVDDLDGLSVGVQKGDSKTIEFIKQHNENVSIVEFSSIEQLMAAVAADELKVIVYYEEPLLWYSSRHQKTFTFRRCSEPMFKDQIHVVVRKGDQKTLDLINKSIDLVTDREREDLNAKWLGKTIYAPLPVKQIKAAFLIIAIIVFIILSIAVVMLRIRGSKLKALLAERKARILDLHHHVRNNLTVILGFIELQKVNIRAAEAKILAENLGKKIFTIAAVHNQLSIESETWNIDMVKLLTDIIENLNELTDRDNITFDIKLEPVDPLPLTAAVKFGLLINEIIDNVFQHAFAEDEEGMITISLSSENSKTVFCIRDNGCGIDEEILTSPESMGIELIRMLADQIGAELLICTEDGCAYKLELPRIDQTEYMPPGAVFTESDFKHGKSL